MPDFAIAKHCLSSLLGKAIKASFFFLFCSQRVYLLSPSAKHQPTTNKDPFSTFTEKLLLLKK